LLGVDVDKLCDEVVRKAKNTIIFRETRIKIPQNRRNPHE